MTLIHIKMLKKIKKHFYPMEWTQYPRIFTTPAVFFSGMTPTNVDNCSHVVSLAYYVQTVITLTSLNYFPLLALVGIISLKKTAGMTKNSGYCVHSIGLRCLSMCVSLFFYLLKCNTRYFVKH